MIQLCAGLGAAHRAHVCHRDIKPGNLFVRTDGLLKILDFGVARLAASSMTGTGFIVGTPDYMSPEQARGLEIDGRSDIFSTGAVFYFMLTGRKPFSAANLPMLFHKIQQADAAPLGPGVPDDLARTVLKALAKEPAARYQSCQELSADLDAIRQRAGLAVPPDVQDLFPDRFSDSPAPISSAVFDLSSTSTEDTVDLLPAGMIDSDEHREARTCAVDRARCHSTGCRSRKRHRTSGPPFRHPPEPRFRGTQEVAVTTKLVVFQGDDVVKEIRLRGTTVRIGRDARNEVALDDPSKAVSRFHAEVRDQGGGYIVADLGSRNGVWIRGERVKNTAPVTLGVPISIGPFELVLEDDVSTSEFEEAPAVRPPVIAGNRAVASRSGTLPGGKAAAKSRLPLRFMPWMAVAAGVAAIAVIAFVVVYNVISGPTTTTTSTALTTSSSSSTTTSVSEAEIRHQKIQELLVLAQSEMDAQNYDTAMGNVDQALAIDPGSVDALNLKQIINKKANPTTSVKPTIDPIAPRPGIPPKPGETRAEYRQRAERIESNYADGRTALGREQFAAALESFGNVERDQLHYMDLDSLVEGTKARQQNAVATAMTNGQQDQERKGFKEARDWYERALALDPTSAQARERLTKVLPLLFQQASALLNKSTLQMKLGDAGAAKVGFQEVMKLLKPDDDLYKDAQRYMKEREMRMPGRPRGNPHGFVAIVAVAVSLFSVGMQARSGQNPIARLFGKNKPPVYNVYRDPANRFQIDYPQKELRVLPRGGSSLVVFTEGNGPTLFVDYQPLPEPLTPGELAAVQGVELERVKKAEAAAKDFTSDQFDAKVGRGLMIRYNRLSQGPEKAMQFIVTKGRDFFRIHCVYPEPLAQKYEPIMLHMIHSFQAPVEPQAPPAPKN